MSGPSMEGKIQRFGLIIGSMKCGTTTLFGHLEQHPEIAGSRPKEVDFFDRGNHWRQGRPWYERKWRQWDPARHKVALEASTTYTKPMNFPYGLRRMVRFRNATGADLRFIYLVRDPIARIESHGNQAQTYPSERPWSEAAWWEMMVQTSDYAAMLDPYAEAFGRDRILVLTLDELKKDPHGVLAKCCHHLGVDPHFRFPQAEAVRNKREDLRVLRRPWQSVRQMLPRDWGSRTAGLIEAVGAWPLTRPLVYGGPADYRLTDEQKAAVRARLAPGIRRFGQTYGVDVAAWGF